MNIDTTSLTAECAIAYENVMTQVDEVVRAALDGRIIFYDGKRFMTSESTKTVHEIMDHCMKTGEKLELVTRTYRTRSLPDRINPFSGEVVKCESREIQVGFK